MDLGGPMDNTHESGVGSRPFVRRAGPQGKTAAHGEREMPRKAHS